MAVRTTKKYNGPGRVSVCVLVSKLCYVVYVSLCTVKNGKKDGHREPKSRLEDKILCLYGVWFFASSVLACVCMRALQRFSGKNQSTRVRTSVVLGGVSVFAYVYFDAANFLSQ